MRDKDNIEARIKSFYEEATKIKFMKDTPVIVYIDGRAFHEFTEGFNKPFDSTFITSMQATMMHLCENIQGCVLGYTQSDEIILVLVDYEHLNSSAWFDYEVQKLCSVSASMATMAFNRYFREIAISKYERDKVFWANNDKCLEHSEQLYQTYSKVFDKAMFDAHCFNVPKEEVSSLFYLRQGVAINSGIQSVAQHYFNQDELQGKSQEDFLYMLLEKDIDWFDTYSEEKRRGSCCIKDEKGWSLDQKIPIFNDKNSEYIDRFIYQK